VTQIYESQALESQLLSMAERGDSSENKFFSVVACLELAQRSSLTHVISALSRGISSGFFCLSATSGGRR
jgi:hypothetical protein